MKLKTIYHCVARNWIEESEKREEIAQVFELMHQYNCDFKLKLREDCRTRIFEISIENGYVSFLVMHEFAELFLDEKLSLLKKNYFSPVWNKEKKKYENKWSITEDAQALFKLLITKLPLPADRVRTAEEDKHELKQLNKLVDQSNKWMSERNVSEFNSLCKWLGYDGAEE